MCVAISTWVVSTPCHPDVNALYAQAERRVVVQEARYQFISNIGKVSINGSASGSWLFSSGSYRAKLHVMLDTDGESAGSYIFFSASFWAGAIEDPWSCRSDVQPSPTPTPRHSPKPLPSPSGSPTSTASYQYVLSQNAPLVLNGPHFIVPSVV